MITKEEIKYIKNWYNTNKKNYNYTNTKINNILKRELKGGLKE